MRITEALKILQSSDKTSSPFRVALACGFTPLHLSTFLAAHLQQRLANRRVEVVPGLYGDLTGTLGQGAQESVDALAVALEWQDLDPRLGFRSSGRWGASAVADIVSQVPQSLKRIAAALEHIPPGTPIALSMPTLPLPPLFHTAGWQAAEAETALDFALAEFTVDLQRRSKVQLVNPRALAEQSPPADRFDLKSDLVTGLPYSLPHADVLASTLARLLAPAVPRKGIITDLDDTLWSGLVGELGPEAVSWDLASHKALHGLYQRLLGALAEEGVLVGVASKNDPQVVAKAFHRDDLLISPASIFPMEVHWNAKSGSVSRILKRWNISADSVVFVDDSPLELAEVAAAHPGIECIQFAGKDYGRAGFEMLRRIRDLFGKAHLSEEDALRSKSIRGAADFEETAGSSNSPEDFLRQLNAVVSFDFPEGLPEPRVLELVNKTNQFNLNGVRYTEAEWAKTLSESNRELAVVTYEDKFGPLGRIGVLLGTQLPRSFRVDVWVLSCRAFTRRIEHQCIRMLFDRHEIDSIEFAFAPTARNGPLADFLKSAKGADACRQSGEEQAGSSGGTLDSGPVLRVSPKSVLGGEPGPNIVLSRESFDRYCPPLYHTVKLARRVEVHG